MDCETFQLIWLYLGIVFVGGVIIGSAKRQVTLQCQDTIHTPKFISRFENEFKVKIQILSSQKIKAFVYQNKIYITMGLLERLNPDELKAVLAHEVYHIRHSPNKLFSSLLALTSLTFRRHNDDPKADDFAVDVAGLDNLIGAFRKLEIIDGEQRTKRLET
jgi:Zn-dependent protease with chaperone function